MCLELPIELVELRADGSARGRSAGRDVEVSLVTLSEPVGPGDWVVAHAGFALHRISAEEAHAALRIREETP
jgi:hydrogenase expression/formation protein HypC